MYQVELTQSLFPAQRDTLYRPTTIAAMIREQARERGETTALREVLADGAIGREGPMPICAGIARRWAGPSPRGTSAAHASPFSPTTCPNGFCLSWRPALPR